jgi:predicted N-acetyltransferase YhbS
LKDRVKEKMAVNVQIRAMKQEDVETCGRICYEAFRSIAERHNFPPDFPSPEVAAGLLSQLLSRDDIYSVVAEADGQVAGSNFLWETAVIAGVGPITVDPDVQNSAIVSFLISEPPPSSSLNG